jgi:hypothetical protein
MSEPKRRFLAPMVGRASDEQFRVATPLELARPTTHSPAAG